eukprot:3818914-Alexandrium_andersonii.AAC.1
MRLGRRNPISVSVDSSPPESANWPRRSELELRSPRNDPKSHPRSSRGVCSGPFCAPSLMAPTRSAFGGRKALER